jgi:hypothetical protein
MTDHARRAEEARAKILASGDPELIKRLHLLEAAAARPAAPGRAGPGLLGTGLAVAGGAWLGTVLAGVTLSGPLQAAFASVAEDLGIDTADMDWAGLAEAEPQIHEAELSEDSGFLDDLGLGDLGDIFDV